jgi:hypothetical protein
MLIIIILNTATARHNNIESATHAEEEEEDEAAGDPRGPSSRETPSDTQIGIIPSSLASTWLLLHTLSLSLSFRSSMIIPGASSS